MMEIINWNRIKQKRTEKKWGKLRDLWTILNAHRFALYRSQKRRERKRLRKYSKRK